MSADRKLTRDEWERLNAQYERTPDPDEGSSASGEHYMLNFILNRCLDLKSTVSSEFWW